MYVGKCVTGSLHIAKICKLRKLYLVAFMLITKQNKTKQNKIKRGPIVPGLYAGSLGTLPQSNRGTPEGRREAHCQNIGGGSVFCFPSALG